MTRMSSSVSREPTIRSLSKGCGSLDSIAFIGTYLPRKCGIATFTADLLRAVSAEAPATRVIAAALNDVPEGYDYPSEVQFEIMQQRLVDYQRAGEFLDRNGFDVVCAQHEYGIFGGIEGNHIFKLLGELRIPAVATLHTVLKDPTPEQKRVLSDLAWTCDRVVVMSEIGRDILRDIYDVPNRRIALIPHGVPDTPLADSSFHKSQLGLTGKKVILTFGLLSPNKGIDVMIRALPRIVARHPDVVYVVVGATHPHIRKAYGESYRLRLQQMAGKLGVDDHLIFRDQFVELSELCQYLGAADVYVTPYLNEAQVVSGTLSYAMASGRAIVSTPYWYAQEALADNRGRLVPFNDAEALAIEINDLLDDDAERTAMRKRAYSFTRAHVWKEVARRYLALFREVREKHLREARPVLQTRALRPNAAALPALRFEHLERLTDDVGVLQHATYGVPNRAHGYCTDDNARALLVVTLAQPHVAAVRRLRELATGYLSFLQHAFNPDTGLFRNFMGYDRRWLERAGSEDSHCRALWALGVTVAVTNDENERCAAALLLRRGLPATKRIRSPRAIAYALLGIDAHLNVLAGDSTVVQTRQSLSTRLLSMYREHVRPQWPWLEDVVTYANGVIPHALLTAAAALEREEMTEAGLRMLKWLMTVQTDDGRFVPIGNNGWYPRGGQRARFDQQPIEAASLIPACVQAYRASGDRTWLNQARLCFRWFLGDNDIGVPVYDEASGGCCDGIDPTGLNQNRGAESTLAWLYSLIQMHALQAEGTLGWTAPEPRAELTRGSLPLEAVERQESGGRGRERLSPSGLDVPG